MSILVSGSFAYDYIMNFPDSFKNHILPNQIHILNVSFIVNKLSKGYGGNAANIAYTIKLLGGEPVPVGAVGPDAKEYIQRFEQLGIETSGIVQDSQKLTASAYITTDQDDNQITAFYEGPLESAANVQVKNFNERPAVALISPTHKRAMIEHLNECADLGVPVAFDPGQQMTAFTGEELQKLISRSHFLIGNDYEIKLLQDRTGWDAKKILAEAKVLITTFGEKGSVITTREGEITEVSACPPLSFDDPTGAGDAYRAGFFRAYELGHNFKTCGQVGSVAASYAIESYGTQAHTFTKQEFTERYERCYTEKLEKF